MTSPPVALPIYRAYVRRQSQQLLRELELQEAEEIEKILADLSNLVAEHTEEISQDFMILAELDFIFAKGELARKMNAVEPEFHTDGIIHLRAARHPLLDPKHVVPIDLTLGKDYNLLIVTGETPVVRRSPSRPADFSA